MNTSRSSPSCQQRKRTRPHHSPSLSACSVGDIPPSFREENKPTAFSRKIALLPLPPSLFLTALRLRERERILRARDLPLPQSLHHAPPLLPDLDPTMLPDPHLAMSLFPSLFLRPYHVTSLLPSPLCLLYPRHVTSLLPNPHRLLNPPRDITAAKSSPRATSAFHPRPTTKSIPRSSTNNTSSSIEAAQQLLSLTSGHNGIFGEEDSLNIFISLVKAGWNKIATRGLVSDEHADCFYSVTINCQSSFGTCILVEVKKFMSDLSTDQKKYILLKSPTIGPSFFIRKERDSKKKGDVVAF